MKKLGLLVMPLMAVSLLASCNQPTPVVDVAHTFHFIGTNCKINGESDYSHNIFEKDKNVQYTIVPNAGYKLPETVEGVEYNPSNGVITITEIKNDIELRVEATHIPQPDVTHTIYLDSAGGTITGKTILEYLPDGFPVETAPTISRAGYDASQVKWYTKPNGEGEEFKFGSSGTPVVTDYFLHAKWGNINQFTVNFYNDDGTIYDSLKDIKVNYGDKVTYKDCPTDATYDDHYKFDGWYNNKPSVTTAQPFPFDTPLTGNPDIPISIYAKHTKKKYHVTFDANGGEITSGGTPLDVTYKDTISADKCPTASRSGYDPTTTWCTDKAGTNVFTFGGTPITDNTTLYAKWGSPTPSTTYTITFDAGDGTFPIGAKTISIEVEAGANIVKAIRTIGSPIKENDKFAYFTYNDGSNVSYIDKATADNITLKAKYINSTLENLSWSEIEHIAIAGHPDRYFRIGEEKSVTLNEWNGETREVQSFAHKVRIIDFYHDDLADGSGKAGITFEFANVITKSDGSAATTIWDGEYEVSGNNYDYRKSVLNNFLNDDVLNMLPSGTDSGNPDLREVIKQVDKKVGVSTDGGHNYSATSFDGSDDYPYPYLFPLAHNEIADNASQVTEGEGTKYQYYVEHPNQEDLIKRKAGIETGNGEFYWLRSPRTLNPTFSPNLAWYVFYDGILLGTSVYNSTYDVAPAFCV